MQSPIQPIVIILGFIRFYRKCIVLVFLSDWENANFHVEAERVPSITSNKSADRTLSHSTIDVHLPLIFKCVFVFQHDYRNPDMIQPPQPITPRNQDKYLIANPEIADRSHANFTTYSNDFRYGELVLLRELGQMSWHFQEFLIWGRTDISNIFYSILI